jgi:hypothetical protein
MRLGRSVGKSVGLGKIVLGRIVLGNSGMTGVPVVMALVRTAPVRIVGMTGVLVGKAAAAGIVVVGKTKKNSRSWRGSWHNGFWRPESRK